MTNMNIGLIQIHSVPKEVEKNVKKGIQMFQQAVESGSDLISFPELWTCGYYLETFDFLAAINKNKWILDTFTKLARDTHTVIVLPLPQQKNGNLYIGSYIIENDGRIIQEYQKSFLWGREKNYFVHGNRKYEPVETSIGKLGILICYDIEFPEPSRILALKGAEIIIVPSVWSLQAMNRWQIQLPSRALDNTVFVLGINNVKEGTCGRSKIISPNGDILAEASAQSEEVLIYDINLDEIHQIRKNIPYLKEYDRYLSPDPELKKIL